MNLPIHRSFKRLFSAAMVALCLPLLSACSTVPVDYANTQPDFDLKTFFNGPIRAEGLFQDRSGKVVNRFYVNILGHWDNGVGTLDERFTYLDGTPNQQRIWILKETGPHRFEGTGHGNAGDIVGTAKGEAYGFALHWSYDVDLPVGDKHYTVHFDDWMYMLNPTTVINRSTVTKFGVRVGEATIVFHKLAPTAANRKAMGNYPSKDGGHATN